MTQSDFTSFYPQFAGFTPAVVLEGYICQANSCFSVFSAEDAEEARRLYTAHKLTMYARGEPPVTASGGNAAGGEVAGNEQSPQWGAATIDGADARYTYAQLAAAGQAQQKIASKKSRGGLRDVFVRGLLFFCICFHGPGGSYGNRFRDAIVIAHPALQPERVCSVTYNAQ